MKIKEIMTSKVKALSPDATLFDIATQMRDFNVGTLPIEEKGKVIGLVTDRDIVIRAVAEGWNLKAKKASDIMSKDIVFCYDDQELDDVAHLFEEKKLYRLPVMGRDGAMVGMFSVTDLAQHASHQLTGEVLAKVSQHTH